ncbi:MAG: hypothetical protein RLN83_00520 [Balneola sp.]
MSSEELYEILTNFDEQSLNLLGFVENEGTWTHPDLTHRIEVHDERLFINLGGTQIPRLNAAFDSPEALYMTFREMGVFESGVHFLYMREKGLNL